MDVCKNKEILEGLFELAQQNGQSVRDVADKASDPQIADLFYQQAELLDAYAETSARILAICFGG